MPKSETIEMRKVRNVQGELTDLPEDNPRATLSSRIRALLLRETGIPQLVHLYGTLKLTETLTLAAGENNCHSMFSDGSYLYAGLATGPAKIVKIDLSDFTTVSTLTLAAGEHFCVSLFSDGSYLYAGLTTGPAKIVKIDLSDFTTVSTLTLAAGENQCRSLFSDGSYLYAGLAIGPAKIVKIDLSDFTTVSTLTLAADEHFCVSLFSDGSYLYAGLNTSPAKIVRRYIIPSGANLRERKIDRIYEYSVEREAGIRPSGPQLNEWWTGAVIDVAVWTTATNGVGAVNAPAAEATGMRYVKLDAGVVAGDYAVLSGDIVFRVMPTTANGFNTRMMPRGVILEWEAKLSLGGGVAGFDNTTCIMGFTEEQAENRSNDDCIGFVIGDAAAAHSDEMYALTDNGSTETETNINTSIGAAGSLGDYDEWHKYRIYAYDGTVRFYIDGTIVATHTTNLPDIDGYTQFWCEEIGGAPDAEISLGAAKCYYL